VSRSQHQSKVHAPHRLEATLPRERGSQSVRTHTSDQARHASDPIQRHKNPQLRTVSAWHDFLFTALLGTAVIGILAYFLGWFLAIVAIAIVIVALALCLNFVINHTIEL